MANIQKVSKHTLRQTIEHYHLDLILFVGYRGSCLSGGHQQIVANEPQGRGQ